MTEMATTEAKVAGSSFYSAMRILPPRERAAMFAIYDFCRQVDDIADEPGPTRDERREALNAWEADLDILYAGGSPRLADMLIEPVRDFGLEKADLIAVIDGMRMDVEADIRAPDFATLDLYCDRVASAVGRLSVKVFGMERDPGVELGHHLGRALQFTNILRDLDEDAGMGRFYLPAEALDAAGIDSRDPNAALADARIDKACRWLSAKAREHYRASGEILARRPKGRLAAPRLMGAVYGQILERMEHEGWAAPRRRVKLSKGRMAWIAVQVGLLGGGLPG